MTIGIREIALFALAALAQPSVWAAAAEQEASSADEASNFTYHTVTTPEGLTFRVPEDMPIETRNGIQAPIPFDEYVYGKFVGLNKRLDRIDKRLGQMEKEIEALKKNREGAKALKSA